MPEVSVIIPVYNTEKYLHECLDSVCNQTFKDIEIICVDDGSTDKSLAVLKQYQQKDDRIKILEQKNKGGGAARNYGLSIAQGDYVIFLDSDDFFEENFISELYSKITLENADMCVCDFRKYDMSSGEYSKPMYLRYDYLPCESIFNYSNIPNYIFNFSSIAVWTKMYSKSFLIENNISFQEIQRHNDAYFNCIALAQAQKICVVDKVLGNYRVGNTTNLQSTNSKSPLDFYIAYREILSKLCVENMFQFVEISYINLLMGIFIQQLRRLRGTEEFKLVYNTIRNQYLLEFNVLKYDYGDIHSPIVLLLCKYIERVEYHNDSQWCSDVLKYSVLHPLQSSGEILSVIHHTMNKNGLFSLVKSLIFILKNH